jgi:hypothetical protein
MAYKIINGMLNEELSRLQALEKKYLDFISHCPKGSIAIKKRNNSSYAYLAYREKNRVFFKYLGRPDSNKVLYLRQRLAKCRELIISLKSVRNDIKKVKRLLTLKSVSKA